MALRKCPICELNYLRGNETICHVCSKAKKRVDEVEEELICIECGENPAVSGRELCRECLLEQKRQADLELLADKIRQDEMDEPLEEEIDLEEEED